MKNCEALMQKKEITTDKHGSTQKKKLLYGWEWKKLGEVFNVERGGSPRPIKKYLTHSPDGINWIKISDATSSTKFIYETKEKITKEGLKKTRLVKEGDFLLSNSMSFGRPYIMKTTGCIHDGWLVLHDAKQYEIDQDFLYYILCSPNIFFQFDSLAAGSTVRNLNISLASSVEIPLPPLPEQKRIVAILDEAFAAIDKAKANAEKNLANAKELFESYLNGIFANPGEDWEEKKLGEVCEIKGGKRLPKGHKLTTTNTGLPYIRARDLKMETVLTGQVQYLQPETQSQIKNYTVDSGDVYITIVGANIGDVGIIPSHMDGANLTENAAKIITKDIITNEYLVKWLVSEPSKRNISKATMAAAQGKLALIRIKDLPILFPSLDIQKKILTNLKLLSKEIKILENIYCKRIVAFDELKKSILKKAFEGEL